MIKAVTAIWAIRDRLDNAFKYVEDDDKTIEKPLTISVMMRKQMAKICNLSELRCISATKIYEYYKENV